MRVAALEDNVAFLEEWCEEQQDTLDRAVGPIGVRLRGRAGRRAARLDASAGRRPAGRPGARVRTSARRRRPIDAAAIVAVVETEYDRKLRQIRAQLNRIRRLALRWRRRLARRRPRAAPGWSGPRSDQREASRSYSSIRTRRARGSRRRSDSSTSSSAMGGAERRQVAHRGHLDVAALAPAHQLGRVEQEGPGHADEGLVGGVVVLAGLDLAPGRVRDPGPPGGLVLRQARGGGGARRCTGRPTPQSTPSDCLRSSTVSPRSVHLSVAFVRSACRY